MKKSLKISLSILAICSLGVVAGCAQLDKISESPEYQKTKQVVSSGVEYLGDKTIDFIENNKYAKQAVNKANELIDEGKQMVSQEVEKIKDNMKQQIKSGVNNQVDKVLEDI